ncbi:MAG: hypothetical protein H6719_23430 [Sandaracinaceae bacterium]|nr:hypothetical protein [Sandaracinaceae bacterium]
MIRALALLSLLLPTAARADWDVQLSTRLEVGGGVYVAEQDPSPWPLFETGLHADLLFGEATDEVVRFGPALDVRTEDFRTLEVGGGLAVLWPTGSGFGFTTMLGAGWGARPEDRDGAFGLGRIAFGWRPYDYFSAYAWTAGVYAAGRVQLEGDRAWEITVGVEVDLELLVAIPFMFFVELARGHDPDEPED